MSLYFDTLKYSEKLKTAGVEHPVVLAEALDEALQQNLFNKYEVEKMLTEALLRFDKRTEEIANQMAVQRAELRAELITEIHKTAYVTIGVISGLFAILVSLATVVHFVH